MQKLLFTVLVFGGLSQTVLFAQEDEPTLQPGLAPIPASGVAPSVVGSSINVHSAYQVGRNTPSTFHANAGDVLSSAGTYGDFSRYLQTFPGVVFNSDESNDVLVRGGNPIENLYLVDGIEVPDINHITGEGTTGGFTSMIDTSSVHGVDLLSGGYSAQYAERLSSVISIHTLGPGSVDRQQGEGEVGYVGMGGHRLLPLGNAGSLLVSGHRSLLNMVTSNVGLDGVPTYTNGLVSGSSVFGSHDAINFLSLYGSDSIDIEPCGDNVLESNTIQTQYGGWRMTNGLRWQHAFSPAITSTFTVSDSEQREHVNQQDQWLDKSINCGPSQTSATLPQVYQERTADSMSILQYETSALLSRDIEVNFGTQARLDRLNYNVAQPVGQLSPFSASTTRSDATSFAPQIATGQTGSWVEATLQLAKPWSVTFGGRLQTFAMGGDHMTLTPRLRTSYLLGEHHSIYAAYAQYAQRPSFIYLESFAQNHTLLPIRAEHLILGAELWKTERAALRLEAYRKRYRDYPVSSEYPQLSLANMVDTLGQQYVWLPLISTGRGESYGVELSSEARWGRHFFLQSNVAYSRARYTGSDGIYRPGNFDFPVVANVSAIWRSARRYEASLRYEFTSGRPYTPFDMGPSLEQNRPIYDLTQLNAVRGPVYSRLDFQFSRIFRIGRREIDAFGGLQNAMDRTNFLGYAWTPRCAQYASCVAANGAYAAIPQIALYPNFGTRMFF